MANNVTTKNMIGMYKYDASKLKTTPLVELTPEVLSYDASTNVLTIEKQYSGAKISGQNITFFGNSSSGISTNISGSSLNIFGGVGTNVAGSSYISIVGGSDATVNNSYNVDAIQIDASTLSSNNMSSFANIRSTNISSATTSSFSAIRDSSLENTYSTAVVAGTNLNMNGAYSSAIIGSGSVTVESPTRTFVAASTDVGLKPYGTNNVIIGTNNFRNTDGDANDAQMNVSYSSILGSTDVSVRKKINIRQLSAIGAYTASIGYDDNAATMSQISIIGCQSSVVNGNVTGLSILGSYGINVNAATDSSITGSSSLTCVNVRYTDISGTYSSSINNIDQGLIAASVASNIESSKTTFSRQFFGFGLNNHWIENTTKLVVFGGGGSISNANDSFILHSYAVNVSNATSASIKFTSATIADTTLVDVFGVDGNTGINKVEKSSITFSETVTVGLPNSGTKKVTHVDVKHCRGTNVQTSYSSATMASSSRKLDTVGAIVEGPAELNSGLPAPATNDSYLLSANRMRVVLTTMGSTNSVSNEFQQTTTPRTSSYANVGNHYLRIPHNTTWLVDATLMCNPGMDNLSDFFGSSTLSSNALVSNAKFVLIRDGAGRLSYDQQELDSIIIDCFRNFKAIEVDALNVSDLVEFALIDLSDDGKIAFSIVFKTNSSIHINKIFCTLHLDICENTYNHGAFWGAGNNMESVAV